jgi:hypothetical protein
MKPLVLQMSQSVLSAYLRKSEANALPSLPKTRPHSTALRPADLAQHRSENELNKPDSNGTKSYSTTSMRKPFQTPTARPNLSQPRVQLADQPGSSHVQTRLVGALVCKEKNQPNSVQLTLACHNALPHAIVMEPRPKQRRQSQTKKLHEPCRKNMATTAEPPAQDTLREYLRKEDDDEAFLAALDKEWEGLTKSVASTLGEKGEAHKGSKPKKKKGLDIVRRQSTAPQVRSPPRPLGTISLTDPETSEVTTYPVYLDSEVVVCDTGALQTILQANASDDQAELEDDDRPTTKEQLVEGMKKNKRALARALATLQDLARNHAEVLSAEARMQVLLQRMKR